MKVVLFHIAQKLPAYLGYFCKKICYQEVKKMGQSGHTDLLSVSIRDISPVPTNVSVESCLYCGP